MASRQPPACRYGEKCYRKNPDHLRNFSHPSPKKDDDSADSDSDENGANENDDSDLTKIDESSDSEVEKQNEGEKRKTQHETAEIPLKKRKTEEDPPETDDGVDEEEDNETEKEEDDANQPASPDNVKESIKLKYLVEMPDDFYYFWDFCLSLNPSEPLDALKCLKLKPVGPFDILAGKHKAVRKNNKGRQPNFLLHYRFYYDPPEFQTVVVSQESDCFHLGYFRDDPNEQPVFVASNTPGSDKGKEKITLSGDNLFAAVHMYASNMVRTANPFSKTSIQKLIKSIEAAASKHRLELTTPTKRMKERKKKVVCPSFHGAGVVVPVDENEIGYRPIPETPGDLKAMFKRISEAKTDKEKDKHMEDLQELITLVQFANDECDYGEGLELGLDLFSFGGKVFHPQISLLLPLAYQLLNRSEFASIISAHLARRRRVDECVDELVCK